MRGWVYLLAGVCAGLLAGLIIATGGGASERMAGRIVQNEWELLMEGERVGEALIIDGTSYISIHDVLALTDLEVLQQEDKLFLFLSAQPFQRPKGMNLTDVERKLASVQRVIDVLGARGPNQSNRNKITAAALQAELAVYNKWKTELELDGAAGQTGGEE